MKMIYLERKYGQVVRVGIDEYDYHKEVVEYLEGKRRNFTLSLDLKGTPFQMKVWKELT